MMTLDLITLLFGNLGLSEVLIIAFVVLLLFGGKKIPELMRGCWQRRQSILLHWRGDVG